MAQILPLKCWPASPLLEISYKTVEARKLECDSPLIPKHNKEAKISKHRCKPIYFNFLESTESTVFLYNPLIIICHHGSYGSLQRGLGLVGLKVPDRAPSFRLLRESLIPLRLL